VDGISSKHSTKWLHAADVATNREEDDDTKKAIIERFEDGKLMDPYLVAGCPITHVGGQRKRGEIVAAEDHHSGDATKTIDP